MLRHHHHNDLFQKGKAEQLHEFGQCRPPIRNMSKPGSKLDLLDTQQMRHGASRIGVGTYAYVESGSTVYTNAGDVSYFLSLLVARFLLLEEHGSAQHLDW